MSSSFKASSSAGEDMYGNADQSVTNKLRTIACNVNTLIQKKSVMLKLAESTGEFNTDIAALNHQISKQLQEAKYLWSLCWTTPTEIRRRKGVVGCCACK